MVEIQQKSRREMKSKYFPEKLVCFLLFFEGGKNEKQHLKFLFTFNPWLLHSFDLPSYGSEMRKI